MSLSPLSSSRIRREWADWECNPDRYMRHPFPGIDRTWNLYVADLAWPAFQRFTQAMVRHDYLFLESAGGTYNCRNVKLPSGPTDVRSIHAYALAVDLNPSKNPYRKPLTHDYPDGFIADVEAIRCANGRPAFQWGGRWDTPDAMHWQIACTPDEAQTIPVEEDPMAEFTEEELAALKLLAQSFNGAVFLTDLAREALEAEAKGSSFTHTLNFYRYLAANFEIGGHLPATVAERLLADIDNSLPSEETVRIVRGQT